MRCLGDPNTRTFTPKGSSEPLYWEKDDTNPNQVIYDLEKDVVIIPQSEDEITND